MREDLGKQIEDARADRRARAQARVAAGWTPPVPPVAVPKPPERRWTLKQIDAAIARHRDECEAMIADAAADSGLHPDEFFVDIVRAYEATAEWELPIVRADFLRGYGLEVA